MGGLRLPSGFSLPSTIPFSSVFFPQKHFHPPPPIIQTLPMPDPIFPNKRENPTICDSTMTHRLTPHTQAKRAHLLPTRVAASKSPFYNSSGQTVPEVNKREILQLTKGKSCDPTRSNDTPQETTYQPRITNKTGTGSLSDNWCRHNNSPHQTNMLDFALLIAKICAQQEAEQLRRDRKDARESRKVINLKNIELKSLPSVDVQTWWKYIYPMI